MSDRHPPDPAAVLAAMQERLAKGPHATLGVEQGASPTDVRAAFLDLTKQFHPTKYARQSSDLQRLANEVFLGIKGAHDLLRVATTSRTTTSPGMAPIQPPPRATAVGIAPPRTPATPAAPAGGAPPVRSTGLAIKPPARADTTRPMAAVATPAPPPPTAPVASPASRVTPPRAAPAQTTDRSFPRIETQPGVTARPAKVDRLDHRLDPSTTRPPQASVTVALDLLANQQWDAARVALNALSAMAPDSQHVRALVCYAAGRQAQVERRLDEARVDLQRALQLDPQLAPAKAALAELFARRK